MTSTQAPSVISSFLKLARPYNALLPMVSTAVAYLASDGQVYWRLGLLLVDIFLIHSAVTIWNDFNDEDVDALNHQPRSAATNRAGLARFTQSVAIIALLIALFVSDLLVLLVLVYYLLGWVYNQKPLQLSRRPISSQLVLYAAYGVLPFLAGLVLAGRYSTNVLLLGMAWSVNRGSLSLLKDYKDAAGDAKVAKKTFLLVYGAKRVAWLSVGLSLLAAIVLIYCYYVALRFHVEATSALVALTMLLIYMRTRLFVAKTYHQMNIIFHRCLRFQLAFDVTVLLWFIMY